MSLRLKAALVITLLAVGVHVYLTNHYYEVNFSGSNEQSMCNVNEVFNCDAVSASEYASLMGVPLSLFGGFTNGFLALLLLALMFRLPENPDFTKRMALYLSGFILLASVVMGIVTATQLNHYCAFCIVAYALSLFGFGLIFADIHSPRFENISGDFMALLGPARIYLGSFILIPVLSFLAHYSSLSGMNLLNLDRKITNYVASWKGSLQHQLTTAPSLTKGPDQAKMVIQEFADFRCGHCGQASKPLGAFAKARSDVRFEFYNFPLDSMCNPALNHGGGTGTSCRMAKATLCAGQQDRGWALHDYFFRNQSDLAPMGDVKKIDERIIQVAGTMGFDWEQLKSCMESPETHDAITAQANLGDVVGVRGTPTIFVNGRKVNSDSRMLFPLMSKIYDTLHNE